MYASQQAGALAASTGGWRERTLGTALALHVLLPLVGNLFDLVWQLALSVPLLAAFGAGIGTGAASIAWNGAQLLVHALTSLALLGMARGVGARRFSGAAIASWGAALSAAVAIATGTALATFAHDALEVGTQKAWAAGLAASWEHVVLVVAWGAVAIALVRGDRAGEADADGLSAWSSPFDRRRGMQAALAVGLGAVEVGVGVGAALVVMPSWKNGVPDSLLRGAAAIGSVTHAALAPAQVLLGIGAIVLGRALSMRAEAAGRARVAATTGIAATLAAAGLQLLVYGWLAVGGQVEAAFVWAGLSGLALSRQVVLTLPWWRVLLTDAEPQARVEAPRREWQPEDRARLDQVGLAMALGALELAAFVALLVAGRADAATTIGLLSVLAGMHLATVPLEWVLLGASLASGWLAARLEVRGRRAAVWGAGTTLAAGMLASAPWVLFGVDAHRIGAQGVWAWAVAVGWTLAKHAVIAAPWARVK